MRVRFALALALGGWVAACAVACGAFSLNDVVPGAPTDAGAEADVKADAVPDSGAADVEAGADVATPCDAGADPCACLPPPTVVSAGSGAILDLRLGSGSAYWFATVGSNLFLNASPVDADGGPPEQLGAGLGLGSAGDFTVDPQYVYFAVGFASPSIARVPVDGGAKQALTPTLPLIPADLTVTADGLYWADDVGEICYAGLDGAIPPGNTQCGGAALSPGPVADASDGVNHLLVGQSFLWLSLQKDGELRRVPIEGGAGTLVASLPPGIRPLAGNDTDVFWAESKNPDAAVVFHETPDGGPPVVAATAAGIDEVAVDGANLYLVAGRGAGRQIVEVSRSSGVARVLACDANPPNFLALDTNDVYWSNSVGEVKRIAK